MAMVRRSAYAIRGLDPPPVPLPQPPVLLPIPNAGAITWRGSIGATGYDVERAPEPEGPWRIAGANVDETFVQYRPLFADESVPLGTWHYRVRARNASGVSDPSNVVGPVRVSQATRVDELASLDRTESHTGDWEIRSKDCRQAKEDAHRAAGGGGATLTYRLPAPIEGFRVFAFFPSAIADLRFSVSANGERFRGIRAGNQVYFEGAGDYGYWKPVEYRAGDLPPDVRWLRIELTGETQLGRVEIDHELD